MLERARKLGLQERLLRIEPEVSADGCYITCMIWMPSGTKLKRRLRTQSTVQNLRDFIETRHLFGEEIPQRFMMVVNYSEGVKILNDMEQTLENAGIAKYKTFTVRIESEDIEN
eukprot:TRINITY_DN16435_c0_g1_i1.p1 TRINITY_DN16435_c0_g1~~TRINITY_DN16435_c0_g1_i1.p1  ORF type:complete len:114 (+),score=30.12 TRINITY_DN16435_c0_g1_i1:362-703(+)